MTNNIAIGSLVKVTFHASSLDRVNDNGQFKTLEGEVKDVKTCEAGKQFILQTVKGFRSFTTGAKIRTLTVDGETLVKEYVTK